MDKSLNELKDFIQKKTIDEAISGLTDFIKQHPQCDEAFYLLGNVYRKQGNWQMALNNYLEAIEKNPESPAVQAHEMLMDILNFYNKDMYNQ